MGSVMKEDSLFLRLNGAVLLRQVNQPRQTIDSGLNMRGSYIDTALGSPGFHRAFDMLFFNERGELTEGGRPNVFVNVDGHWWTPPVSSGLLPGVTRSVVLDDPAWSSAERVLARKGLARAHRRFHGLQRVARSIESGNRKPMNQDSALLNYPSSNAAFAWNLHP